MLAALAGLLAWSPDPASSTSGATAIAAGSGHDCVITAAGGVQCWGDNLENQLGLGYADADRHFVPEDVPALSGGIAAVTADERYSCALNTEGSVYCWGSNAWGQMGDGTNEHCCKSPTKVAALSSGVNDIEAGQFHSCALMESGAVKCWGTQAFGQLGDGSEPDGHISAPVDVVGIGDAVAVTSGGRHSCALTAGGHVKCWGVNAFGQLGDGTTADSTVPVDVLVDGPGGDPLTDIVAVSAGWGHTCALTSAGAAKCWGLNHEGQLGNGTTADGPLPTDVTGLGSGVIAISAGFAHTCALTGDGGAKCWGDNTDGQLGIGTVEPVPDTTTPLDVEGLSSSVTILAAGYLHACAVASGDVMCWGLHYGWSPTALPKPATPTPTLTASPTPTGTPTRTPTPVLETATSTASNTATMEPTLTPTPTPTATTTRSPTALPSPTASPSPSPTASPSPTPTASPSPSPSPTAEPLATPPASVPGLTGDSDCDGAITSADALLILQLAAHLIVSLPCPENGDVRPDGQIGATDATLILQYVAGLLESLPPQS